MGLKFGGHLVHNVDFIVIENIGNFLSMNFIVKTCTIVTFFIQPPQYNTDLANESLRFIKIKPSPNTLAIEQPWHMGP